MREKLMVEEIHPNVGSGRAHNYSGNVRHREGWICSALQTSFLSLGGRLTKKDVIEDAVALATTFIFLAWSVF